MIYQFGGLKSKHLHKKGFNPVADMINSTSAKISLLTHSCATGFLFVLNVDKNDSEYHTVNYSGRFTEDITSFVLKIVVIQDIGKDVHMQYDGIDKTSITSAEFFEEAKLQQAIWKNSILGGKPAICPPVGNFSLFANPIDLLNVLSRKSVDPFGDTKVIMKFIVEIVSTLKNVGIGIILMPNLENAENIYTVLSGTDKHIKDAAIESAGAQTIRLFISFGTIHIDEHAGNVLVYKDNKNQIQTSIIDFGRGSDLNMSIDDEFLTALKKKEILKQKDLFFAEFNELVSPPRRSQKKSVYDVKKFVENVVGFYLEECKKVNMRKYNHAYGQIEWLSTYIQQNPYICEEIFISLKTMMMGDGELSTEGLQIKTIKEYEQKEHFPNFSKDVDHFRYEFVDKKCDVVGCAISGGMKKKKKSRLLRHRRRTMKKNRSAKF